MSIPADAAQEDGDLLVEREPGVRIGLGGCGCGEPVDAFSPGAGREREHVRGGSGQGLHLGVVADPDDEGGDL